ncbi:hypothetical protein [Aeoliella mucimassa]|uniref:Uncharacterized protein n=1 Tax=Aeoliella mucimassa TaxID=2527972 RepID=A0A518AVS5_9BACT|nr:hypothetical protein [Aeoliella mucimassa]QDU58837.1 hypothetical protein Pan181_50770 [Aeoliella mucimassa]
MSENYDNPTLEAYLDEALPPELMAEIEEALRDSDALREQLKAVVGRRDAGVHTIGSIWRRHRLSCPDRSKLGSYLLGVLTDDETDFIRFHLEVARCRLCTANLSDLEQQQAAEHQEEEVTRRKKYFQSSVGHLPKD